MTEQITETQEATKTCSMGSKTEHPCPYPATEPIPRWGAKSAELCAFHAALEPLEEETDELYLGLDLFESWKEEARSHENAPVLRLLERAAAEFSSRLEHANKTLGDLKAAHFELTRH